MNESIYRRYKSVDPTEVERRLEHYASCRFLGSLGLGLPTQYACRPVWPSKRNGEEAGPIRDLLPLDMEINFTNKLISIVCS